MGWERNRFLESESIIEDLICCMCTDVVQDPVQAPCQHTYCDKCIKNWLARDKGTCPECRTQLSLESLAIPSRMIQKQLGQLTIRCQNYVDSCRLMCKFEHIEQLKQHEQRGCQSGNAEDMVDMILKNKTMELEKVLSQMGKTIREKETVISEKDTKMSTLEKMLNEKRIPMESTSWEPSAPSIEMLEPSSTTGISSELSKLNLLEGTLPSNEFLEPSSTTRISSELCNPDLLEGTLY